MKIHAHRLEVQPAIYEIKGFEMSKNVRKRSRASKYDRVGELLGLAGSSAMGPTSRTRLIPIPALMRQEQA